MKNSEERRLLTRFNMIMDLSSRQEMPEHVRNKIPKIEWKSCTISQLRMAANDQVERLQHLQGADLKEIDELLQNSGAATISQLRDKGFMTAIRLISKRQIKKEEELYLLKSLIDQQDERFSANQLALAETLIDDYAQT